MTMIRRLMIGLCLLAACVALPADAAPAKRKAPPARKAAAGPGASVTATPPPARTVAAPRRLEDIHIEGEIPAPQVLFVTARDQRRLTQFHHRRYLRTSAQVGEATPLPTRVALTTHPATPAGSP